MKKRVDKGFLIPSIGLLIVFLIIFGFEYVKQQPVQENEKLSPEKSNLPASEDNQDTQKDREETIEPVISEESSIGGGGGGSSGGSSESSSSGEAKTLPADLYTAPCGLYSEEYGVCTGSCPEGVCVNEGRSCYCKIIE